MLFRRPVTPTASRSHRRGSVADSSFAEELSLTAQRDSLLQELNNIKDHLRLRGKSLELEPVVVSKSVLREVHREDVLARRSRQDEHTV